MMAHFQASFEAQSAAFVCGLVLGLRASDRRRDRPAWLHTSAGAFHAAAGRQRDGHGRNLNGMAAGVFTKAAMHTPVDVTAEAIAHARSVEADCLVALGGGSTTGLGKAIAYQTDLPQIVIPTTYAGI
jgi:maleylacetate reductase